MYLSQSKAAKLAGVSRPTITRRIEDNLLSKQPEGIDVADLRRCFTYITDEDVERIQLPATKRRKLEQKQETSSGSLSKAAEVIQKHTEYVQQLLDEERADNKQLRSDVKSLRGEITEATKREAEWKEKFIQQAQLPAPEPKPEAKPLTVRQRLAALISGKTGSVEVTS